MQWEKQSSSTINQPTVMGEKGVLLTFLLPNWYQQLLWWILNINQDKKHMVQVRRIWLNSIMNKQTKLWLGQ